MADADLVKNRFEDWLFIARGNRLFKLAVVMVDIVH
jgi:hypothetical protein